MVEISAADAELIESEVDAAVRGYLDALSALDIDQVLDFWADVEGFTVAADGGLVVGYGSWADACRDVVAGLAKVDFIEISNPQVFVLGLGAASYSMEFAWRMTSKDGEVTNSKGSWMHVFKRFPDRWRVVHSAGTHIYS